MFQSNQLKMSTKAKVFIYANKFKGEPKLSDFQLQEEDLPAIQDGEFMAEAIYLSVDPYMRPYMARFPVGCNMIGGQVAKWVTQLKIWVFLLSN